MNKPKILIIEDEREISRFMELELRCEGYEVRVEADGMQGLMAAREQAFDLIVLDRMLPGMEGLEICRRLRKSSRVPIIILTARGEVLERVEGLDSGANDYLTKPFHLEELLARVRLQLRISNSLPRDELSFADLVLNIRSRTVQRRDLNLELSPREFELLQHFLEHPRQVLTRSDILEKVWGWNYDGHDNVLDVFIHTLREKLERGGAPRLLFTVRGVGYVLQDPV
ncbi:MAG: response regulator transcription factor [Candidatus Sericytochromatia bacterium]